MVLLNAGFQIVQSGIQRRRHGLAVRDHVIPDRQRVLSAFGEHDLQHPHGLFLTVFVLLQVPVHRHLK